MPAFRANKWTSLPDRIWPRLTLTPTCWLWGGARYKRGYGRLLLNGRQVYAHRVAWELLYGPIPAGLEVCHRCNVKLCVRPDHLYLGTHALNMADASADGLMAGKPGQRRGKHGHHARGSASGRAKLTEADVLEIRRRAATGEKYRDLAVAFGVSFGLIGHIVTRRSWTHI